MNAIILASALLGTPATPEQAVATLWRALSHDAGQAGDEAALRAILHPDAMVYGARYRNGAAALSVARGTDFAAVYSVVESRNERSAPNANFTGVNSIQLYRADDGWRIIGLYYQVERPGQPISLQGGKPGACLEG